MKTIFPDTEFESELQELYVLSKHWMQDISFIEDELRFFKNILNKYLDGVLTKEIPEKRDEFARKIALQETNITFLKDGIQQYLKFLEPYIDDGSKTIGVTLIEKFTGLQTEINALFTSVKTTKNELFKCAEEILEAEKSTSSNLSPGNSI